MSCDFIVDARIIGSDGVTVRASMQDEANGLILAEDIAEPDWDEVQQRVTSVYMHGSTASSLPTLSDGLLAVKVWVQGSTWTQVRQRVAALKTAWRAEDKFFLAVELEGVTTKYIAERASWQSEPVSASVLSMKEQMVTLVFRVQPNPVETYGDESS